MVFSSHFFVLVFLPCVLVGFYLVEKWLGNRASLCFLLASSYIFYAWDNYDDLFVLVGITALNYFLGRRIAGLYERRAWMTLWWWTFWGVATNLVLLGFFKYAGFLVRIGNFLFDERWSVPQIALPLGISFFVFHSIAYVVDTSKQGKAEPDATRFSLFVGFFAHMVAGPILRPSEFLPQLDQPVRKRLSADMFARGLGIFAIGLFKKSCLADSIRPFVSATFEAVAGGHPITIPDSWAAALGYAMQIYFDFSGYSDMAIGIALLFGIRLPLNFDSPYRATSLIDFWRRWHMTLSRFLRDYLYIPLGGNRRGGYRRYMNILITMTLGGLWHGANWTFVAWGLIHGIALCVNHLCKHVLSDCDQSALPGAAWIGRALTFLVVVIAWVFFRAPDMQSAEMMLGTMFGFSQAPSLGFSAFAPFPSGLALLAALLVAVWFLPNSQTIMGYTGLDAARNAPRLTKMVWKANTVWALGVAVIMIVSILNLSDSSEFIYFHF